MKYPAFALVLLADAGIGVAVVTPHVNLILPSDNTAVSYQPGDTISAPISIETVELREAGPGAPGTPATSLVVGQAYDLHCTASESALDSSSEMTDA